MKADGVHCESAVSLCIEGDGGELKSSAKIEITVVGGQRSISRCRRISADSQSDIEISPLIASAPKFGSFKIPNLAIEISHSLRFVSPK